MDIVKYEHRNLVSGQGVEYFDEDWHAEHRGIFIKDYFMEKANVRIGEHILHIWIKDGVPYLFESSHFELKSWWHGKAKGSGKDVQRARRHVGHFFYAWAFCDEYFSECMNNFSREITPQMKRAMAEYE